MVAWVRASGKVPGALHTTNRVSGCSAEGRKDWTARNGAAETIWQASSGPPAQQQPMGPGAVCDSAGRAVVQQQPAWSHWIKGTAAAEIVTPVRRHKSSEKVLSCMAYTTM